MRRKAKARSTSSAKRGGRRALYSLLSRASILALVAAALLLPAELAGAATIHTHTSSFGTAGSGDGQFSEPAGVAIEQSTGAVYVADTGNHRVQKFAADGTFLAAWGWGVQNGAAESQVCTSGCQAGIPGDGAGQFETPVSVAVDNSGGPSSGAVYVGDPGRKVVAKFAASGTHLATNDGSVSGTPLGESFSGDIAVDSNGSLFIENFGTYQFAHDGTFITNNNNAGGGDGLAVDSAGNLYTNFGEVAGIIKYNFAEGFSTFSFFLPIRDLLVPLAVDPAADALYVACMAGSSLEGCNGEIRSYVTSENEARLIEAFGQGLTPTPAGIAVRGSNGMVYVSEPSSSSIEVFSSIFVPDATTGAASNLTTDSATLNGAVNPLGMPSEYQFEWGETEAYGNLAPASPEDAGEGSSPLSVSEDIAGLQPGTTYHYRLSATNANGTFHGPDRTFTTLLPVTIEGVFASDVASTSATVNATINPGGGETTYRVEYGTTAAYGASAPTGDGRVGSGWNGIGVAQALTGLQPDTVYHYRFVAENAGGPIVGTDRTLRTAGPPAVGLPDNRAYEMVSPPWKNGGDIATHPDVTRVASDGNAVAFTSQAAFADSMGTNGNGNEYIAERSPGGWATHGITPLQIPQHFPQYSAGFIGDFSADLSKGIFLASSTLEPGHPNVQDSYNLYQARNLRTPQGGEFKLFSDSVNPVSNVAQFPYQKINYAAVSSDFSHLLFENRDNLTADANVTSPADPKVYLSVEGDVRLEGLVPPPGETACGPSGPACEVASSSIAASGVSSELASSKEGTYATHSLSADGSRVFFAAPPFEDLAPNDETGYGTFGRLYLREDGESTTQINASERSTPDPEGTQPAKFLDATPDGSKAFFVTKEQMVDEDTNPGYDIYMYEVGAPAGARLTLISKDGDASDGSGNAHFVVGTSTDGSYVYFSDDNQLVPGQPSLAELDLLENEATAEFMYVWHSGEIRFVGAHSGREKPSSNWGKNAELGALASLITGQKTAVVTPDGRHVVFTSDSAGLAELTAGADIGSPTCGGFGESDACQQIFAYGYAADHLACASCSASGQAPSGPALTTTFADDSAAQLLSPHVNRPISDDGRYVFFSSPDPLVSIDNNHRHDAYQFNTITGKVALISTGQCNCDSYFVEQSPDGRDVFFTTRQRLVAIDIDGNADLYDARIGGGIAAQNATPPAQCQGDACQPNPSPPNDATPASASLVGAGNLREASKAKQRKKSRRKQKKRHKRGRKAAAKHKHNRGGVK